ncbi:MAG TPA: hypothetical protein VE981_11575 [Planctomycetota bacterium]|nr:hypothetical protein [Planctomycetota bacterium]
MSGDDVFEKNVARLVKASALPADPAAQSRARERFLREAGAAPSRPRYGSVAAAALFVCVLIAWATRTGTVPEGGRPTQDPTPFYMDVSGTGGNSLLKGKLRFSRRPAPVRQMRFEGRSPLPDGVYFRVQTQPLEEQVEVGTLVSRPRLPMSTTLTLTQGGISLDWTTSVLGPLRLVIDAADGGQDMEVAAKIQAPEAQRKWTFDFAAWDDGLLPRLEPQLAEIGDLAREAKDLIDRVEAAVADQKRFKEGEKAIAAEAGRLQKRLDGFAAVGLYPAACHELAYALRDLVTAMGIFTWSDGKFAGPVSYYTNNKPARTFRNDEFAFAALRRYVDGAVFIGGREFCLWILRESARGGSKAEIAKAVERAQNRPGIRDFGARLTEENARGLEGEVRFLRPITK